MSLANAFRLSFYLSMAMSCICLFYGEWDFIPWMTAMLPLVLAIMVAAYRREGHEYLSEQTANRIGTFIGLGMIVWIVFKVPRSDQDIVSGGIPWPAALVPLLAPLLPILLLVKLFRPKKLRDFWVFQTIALVIVTLSCILAGEAIFFVLLSIFLVVQLWCLCLFFLYRHMILARDNLSQSRRQQVALFGDWQSPDPTPIPRQYLRTGRVLGWSMVVLVAGLGLFLLMPRFTDSPWIPAKLSAPGRRVIKTGIDPNAGMDLYREGTVELSKDPAFEVEVRDQHGGPGSLPANQHFRLQILDEYERGRWLNWTQSSLLPRVGNRKPLPNEEHFIDRLPFPDWTPPEMKEGQVFLVYQVSVHVAGGLPLADPIIDPEHVGLYPEVVDGRMSHSPYFKLIDESDTYMRTSILPKRADKQVKYGQILVPKFQSKEIPAINTNQRYLNHLLAQEVPNVIQTWTRDLVRKLPGLTEADYGSAGQFRIVPAQYAKVATALSRHLAESGEFTYSLRLHPLGVTMDPTAEFLLKVKEGHCERYAAGLTLMLRSLAIPARIVRGYNGCDQAEKGRYIVHLNQAHSWVEALVPSKDGTNVWLQLDPTPSVSANSDSVVPFFKWAWNRIVNPEFTWKSMVMDYNTDRQTEVGDQFKLLWNSVSNTSSDASTWEVVWGLVRWPALGLLCLLAAFIGYRGYRHWGWFAAGRLPGQAPMLGFYAHLLKVLERHCQLRPKTGQTPLEFAQVAQADLASRLIASPALAELPVRAAGVLYEHRFGNVPLTAEVSQAVDFEVTLLDTTLRANGK